MLEFDDLIGTVAALAAAAQGEGLTTEDLQQLETESGDELEMNQ